MRHGALSGCGPSLLPETHGSSGESTSTTEPIPGSSSDPSATGATGMAGSTTRTDDGSSSATTGEPEECESLPDWICEPLDSDACPDGLKCTYDYHPKAHGQWACGCIRGDAGAYMECDQDDTPSDTCAPEQECISATFHGPHVCIPVCGSSQCPETSVCLGDHCYQPCDPLAAYDCEGSLACVPSSSAFWCLPTNAQQPEVVGLGEACLDDGGCEHGLVCRLGSEVSGCTTDRCCAAVCDTTAVESCAPGETCVPLFDDPMPGSETFGACTPA